jgi:hypothetical protein
MLYRKDRKGDAAAAGDGAVVLAGTQSGRHEPASNRVEQRGHQYVLVVRGEGGAPEVRYCEHARDAAASMEALIGDGRDRESIELFRASRVAFDVSYRPVVRLEIG